MNARQASPLGTEIRDRRQQLGLSVRALAARADISPAYVTALETGNNPSTRRPPVPSLAIVRRVAEALDLELGALIRAGDAVRPEEGAHVLVYVVAPPPTGLLGAVDAALGADVDHWLHLADPRRTDDDDPARATTRRFALGAHPYATPHLDPDALVAALDHEVAVLATAHRGERVGLLIADCSAVMRYLQDAAAEVALEATWHQHVRRIWQEHFGGPPAVDVCAYDHDDLAALGLTIDQLATALELVSHHDHTMLLDGDRAIAGAPAIRRILDEARPAGTSRVGWQQLTAAAARTLAGP
jgi:transcriptional regulator with XRE-family HTH domain